MNKKRLVILLMALLVLCLSGCKKSNFGVRVNEDMNVEINAENASNDMFGAASGFEVAEGQKVYIEPALTKGEISVRINAVSLTDIDAKPEELLEAVTGTDNTVLDLKINGIETSEYELEPGTYSVSANVLTKADGKVIITVR